MGSDGHMPEVYRRALELQAAGLDPAGIARALDVDPAAITNLLRLAAAKAARARDGERVGDVKEGDRG